MSCYQAEVYHVNFSSAAAGRIVTKKWCVGTSFARSAAAVADDGRRTSTQ